MLFKVKPKDENRINMKKKYTRRFNRKRAMGYILQKSCYKNKLLRGEHL